MKTGLTLGKFAPLHRGHQKVIEASLNETDQTLVLIYDCPELDTPPLAVRSQWIRDLYPQAKVLEAWDGPSQTGLDPATTKMHDDYLRSRLSAYNITHFFSSEAYGEHVSQALGAIDRRIDMDRSDIPVSGTAIRADLGGHQQFLSARVLRDLLTHVVFLGAPSTGKSTLARRLSEEFATPWMPEYGREYWQAHQVERRLTLDQLVEISEGHRLREDALLASCKGYLFVDTEAMITRQFSLYYHDAVHPRLEEMARQSRDRYDLFFVCDTDVPYEDTWDRSGEVNRMVMQRAILSELAARRIPYLLLRGTLEERVATVKKVLRTYKKFSSLPFH